MPVKTLKHPQILRHNQGPKRGKHVVVLPDGSGIGDFSYEEAVRINKAAIWEYYNRRGKKS